MLAFAHTHLPLGDCRHTPHTSLYSHLFSLLKYTHYNTYLFLYLLKGGTSLFPYTRHICIHTYIYISPPYSLSTTTPSFLLYRLTSPICLSPFPPLHTYACCPHTYFVCVNLHTHKTAFPHICTPPYAFIFLPSELWRQENILTIWWWWVWVWACGPCPHMPPCKLFWRWRHSPPTGGAPFLSCPIFTCLPLPPSIPIPSFLALSHLSPDPLSNPFRGKPRIPSKQGEILPYFYWKHYSLIYIYDDTLKLLLPKRLCSGGLIPPLFGVMERVERGGNWF